MKLSCHSNSSPTSKQHPFFLDFCYTTPIFSCSCVCAVHINPFLKHVKHFLFKSTFLLASAT
uniref:Uncharacterized protein n=1 Tax=Octopus bimaculoides TaxID=37653 RepID=A0A0L8FWX3_OCTBM